MDKYHELDKLISLKEKTKKTMLDKGYTNFEMAKKLYITPQYLSRLLNYTITAEIYLLEKMYKQIAAFPSIRLEFEFYPKDVSRRIYAIEMTVSGFARKLPLQYTYQTVRRIITECYPSKDHELLRTIMSTLERLELEYAKKRKKY